MNTTKLSNSDNKEAKAAWKPKAPKIVGIIPNKNDDPILHCDIANHVMGHKKPEWSDTNSCLKYGRKYGDMVYLFGIVVQQEDKQKQLYTVEWEDTLLGTKISDLGLGFRNVGE